MRAAVSDVWSTLHFPEGDVDTEWVENVTVRGRTVTFHLVFDRVPFSGTVDRSTLHVGPLTADLRVAPPATVRKGDTVTVVHEVELLGLDGQEDA